MELAEYREHIVRPISSKTSVGERLIDDPLFDFIEDQMMKVGSLSHGSVQWDEVEHSIVKLFSEKTKDIKLLVHLLQCLHNQVNPQRLIVSFGVMNDFIAHYWETCYPAPGKRGNLPRRKFFSQMVQRFSLVLEKIDFNLFDTQDRDALLSACEEWQKTIEKAGLTNDVVSSVAISITSELRKVDERQKTEQPEIKQNVAAPITTTSTPSVSVDSTSDKATKQSLLKVADFLGEQEFGSSIGIRLRRYAVWGAITTLPDHDANGETLLRGMQADRVKDYQDKLRQPDLVLWRQVEQSLTMAPYWFEGHLMSYQIAKSLGKQEWCESIASETRLFLQRLPELMSLKFKGGEPFVPQSVIEWINETDTAQSSSQSALGDWQELRKEAFSLAKEGGIAVALSMLNDGLVKATEPRDRFYWRMLSADLLQANHLDEMAASQYQTLYEQVLSMKVTDWEPTLVEELKRYATSD
ncbi:type VI secretion system protein TssA [Vibrio sp. TRT 21S02]|uniref:type VI secretion system protein TssA n=1 Tax=Vibrio sp. TRT 21S02 TaxID=3418507 RepID=UPI003CEA5DDA